MWNWEWTCVYKHLIQILLRFNNYVESASDHTTILYYAYA